MADKLQIYNSLTRKKELFEPLNPPFVGMYVCGPTVYGDPHLGHGRAAITFDVVFRYLKYLGYKVRYVSNITDVGHLEDELAGAGEDKIAKKARIEQLEPMEVVQYYTNRYHKFMQQLNVLPPSIEPHASGHIIEQIKMIEKILEAGYAYETNGSVYFDVKKYNEDHEYGKLSGRKLEDLLENTRQLEGQQEKRHSFDFALWKKAAPEHLMHWPSPWSEGFPGWHLECSAMGTKYLGDTFDIHGGGMDLKFPHHECEIAQSVAATDKEPVKYWMHNNLITIDGQKMSKSLSNFITLEQLFEGKHERLEKAFSPMTLRFFILQAHYRGLLDFSNEALDAAEKGFKRLMNALESLSKLKYEEKEQVREEEENEVKAFIQACEQHMSDDFNTAQVLAALFELSAKINAFANNQLPLSSISKDTFEQLKDTFSIFIKDILGLKEEKQEQDEKMDEVMQILIGLRQQARQNKDFATSDKIREELVKAGIILKDSKDGTDWDVE